MTNRGAESDELEWENAHSERLTAGLLDEDDEIDDYAAIIEDGAPELLAARLSSDGGGVPTPPRTIGGTPADAGRLGWERGTGPVHRGGGGRCGASIGERDERLSSRRRDEHLFSQRRWLRREAGDP